MPMTTKSMSSVGASTSVVAVTQRPARLVPSTKARENGVRKLLPLALLMTTAAAPISADKASAILVDGKCTDATWRRARSHDMGQGATVKFAADRDFVWLCIIPPPESFGSVDVYLRDTAGALHNLHSSAQLGERLRGADGWPGWTWWNNRDWYGNPVYTYRKRDGEFGFRPSEGREMQIARSRFPGRTWTLMIDLQAIGPNNVQTMFPAGAKVDDPSTWATLTL